jgi:hypothetical protein
MKVRAGYLGIRGVCYDFETENLKNTKFSRKEVIDSSTFSLNAFVHGRIDNFGKISNYKIQFAKYSKVYCNNSKVEKKVYPENWVCRYFENLDEIIWNCSDFYFLNSENYRQYSILFKILSLSKSNIYVTDNLLYDYIIKIINNYNLPCKAILINENT